MNDQKQKQTTLQRLAEFETLLQNYRPSETSIASLRATPLILLVGPTAAGRNTLMDLLVKTGRYLYIPSDTTRPKRRNNGVMEQDGVEYWFKPEDDVLAGIKDGKYIEAAIIHNQQVSGVHIDQLESARKQGKFSITEVEVQGAATYRQYKPDVITVFLLPPDFEIWMQRLSGRGDMEEDEFRRRLESAQSEIAIALAEDYYTFVINREIHEAAVTVDGIATGNILEPAGQEEARAHAEQLAIDVQLYLNA